MLRRLDDRLDRLLDAKVADVVPVVGQDDVDEVLADVMDIALDGGEHHAGLTTARRALEVWLQMTYGGLHGLGGLQHEGQLHLSCAEQIANDLHAREQMRVDDV